MTRKALSDSRNKAKDKSAQTDGIPTTGIEIGSGKSWVEKNSAKTEPQLEKKSGCSKETLSESNEYDPETGLPTDKTYLECDLPGLLPSLIEQMQASWNRLDRGEEDLLWDCYYCELQSTINSYEVNDLISEEQAWYLREKYLGMERSGKIQ